MPTIEVSLKHPPYGYRLIDKQQLTVDPNLDCYIYDFNKDTWVRLTEEKNGPYVICVKDKKFDRSNIQINTKYINGDNKIVVPLLITNEVKGINMVCVVDDHGHKHLTLLYSNGRFYDTGNSPLDIVDYYWGDI